jgi:5-hydroxyisourate hydrolase
MSDASVSTHVLDATAGTPAAGIRVVLESRAGSGSWHEAGRGVTDPGGRLRFPDGLPAGEYRISFGTGEYFGGRGTATFYPEVTVTFAVTEGHYHVPLLLSPFAYSTYRGS